MVAERSMSLLSLLPSLRRPSGLPAGDWAHPDHGPSFKHGQGDWQYIVVDPRGIHLRSNPAYDKSLKLKDKLEEGEVVRISERTQVFNGTSFLRLADNRGWCFDVQPNTDRRPRMVEVQRDCTVGFWRVVAQKGVGIRSRPTFLSSAVCERGPEYGGIVATNERVRCGDTLFLRLADGRGWVFDRKPGKQILAALPGPATTSGGSSFACQANNALFPPSSEQGDGGEQSVDDTGPSAQQDGNNTGRNLLKLWKMGFQNAAMNREALRKSEGDLDAAVEWLYETLIAKPDGGSTSLSFAPPPRSAAGGGTELPVADVLDAPADVMDEKAVHQEQGELVESHQETASDRFATPTKRTSASSEASSENTTPSTRASSGSDGSSSFEDTPPRNSRMCQAALAGQGDDGDIEPEDEDEDEPAQPQSNSTPQPKSTPQRGRNAGQPQARTPRRRSKSAARRPSGGAETDCEDAVPAEGNDVAGAVAKKSAAARGGGRAARPKTPRRSGGGATPRQGGTTPRQGRKKRVPSDHVQE